MGGAFAPFRDAVQALAPRTAIVLGSGLGEIAHFTPTASISFSELGLAPPSVGGHSGRLALGMWRRTPVLIFFGRLHFYEGHSWSAVTAPVRLAAQLGVARLILTNAAGGIQDLLEPGSLMAIRGHLGLQDPQAWRSPDVVSPYSAKLVGSLQAAGLLAGVYAALTGPSYETPAEIRAYRSMGADAVGMSTAKEAETAAELGLEVAAISCITNRAAGLCDEPLSHADVLANATRAVDRLSDALGRLIALR